MVKISTVINKNSVIPFQSYTLNKPRAQRVFKGENLNYKKGISCSWTVCFWLGS
jgi:hypothetical protein